MNIKFSCADCGKDYKVPDKFAGKKVKCKKCGAKIRVPDGAESPAKASSGKSSTRSATAVKTSARTSARKSARTEKATSSRVKKRKKTSVKVLKTTANGTQIIEMPDLEPEKKLYESKKKDEKKMARGAGRLVYFEAGKAKKSYRLDGKTRVVGRGGDCEICIDDASLSEKHCKIEVRLGKFTATDLKSSNGLIVNHKKVRRASLKNGDLIQLGRAVLRIDCG